MKCKVCDHEMKRVVCKYVTVYTCTNYKHKQILEWDERF